jgi:hypothetical protein
MIRAFIAVAFSVLASGCAGWDTTVPSSAQRASFDPAQSAYLIVNFTGGLGCDWVTLGINRLGSGYNEVIYTNRDTRYPSSEPAILAVVPGTYRLNRGRCVLAGGVVDLRRAAAVHGPVDIHAGEVVYIGALEMNRLRVRYVIDPTSPDTTEDNRGTANYFLYQMVDNSEDVRPRVAERFPELGAQMMTRIPEVLVSPEVVEARIRSAFLPDSGGVLPTRAEAQRRIEESVFRDLERELREFEREPAPTPLAFNVDGISGSAGVR